MDTLLANLQQMTHRYFDSTTAVEAARILDTRDDASLADLLESHWVKSPSPGDIEARDAFDELIAYYAMLEVAAIAGCLPDPLPPDIADVARRRLTRPAVHRYFSKLYPLALPQLFVRRLEGNGLHGQPAYPLLASFLQVSAARRTDDIDMFLWFLDDGWEGDTGLPQLVALFGNAGRLAKELTAERSTPLRQGARGLLAFLRFARELDGLLASTESYPLLQSAFWHVHGYWFQQLGLQLAGVLASTIESYRHQVGEGSTEEERILVARTHADMNAAHRCLQRLCSGFYSAGIDRVLYATDRTRRAVITRGSFVFRADDPRAFAEFTFDSGAAAEDKERAAAMADPPKKVASEEPSDA